jgi:hypothetical protein
VRDITFEIPVESDEAAIDLVRVILRKLGDQPIENVKVLTSFLETKPRRERAKPIREESPIDVALKPDSDIISYVTSQPKFTHDLFSVQEHVYGRIFRSRGAGQKMYHKTRRQLGLVQKKIEEIHGGEFKKIEDPSTGIKRFVFEKMQVVEELPS